MQQFPETLDRDSFEKLKARLKSEKAELSSVREQLFELKKTEKFSTLEDPNSALHTLLSRETSLASSTSELESYLSHLEKSGKIIEEQVASDVVGINDIVTLYIVDSEGEKDTETHKLVTLEPDISKGEISKNSPIGAAILGKKIGETVEANVSHSGMKLTITILSKI